MHLALQKLYSDRVWRGYSVLSDCPQARICLPLPSHQLTLQRSIVTAQRWWLHCCTASKWIYRGNDEISTSRIRISRNAHPANPLHFMSSALHVVHLDTPPSATMWCSCSSAIAYLDNTAELAARARPLRDQVKSEDIAELCRSFSNCIGWAARR